MSDVSTSAAYVAEAPQCTHARGRTCSTGRMPEPKQPEHWKDTAPNEPEPKTFLRETPTAHWWILLALAVMSIVVLGGAFLVVQ